MKKIQLKKKNKVILIIAIFIIVVSIFLIYYFIDVNKYKKYEQYEQVMDMYGFSRLYNNETAKSNEFVTNVEALKILIAASLNNTQNVQSLVAQFSNDKDWYQYAKNMNIVYEDIEENDLNKKIKYIEVIKEMSDCKLYLLNGEIASNIKPTYSDYNEYKQNDKYSIIDLVSSEIINNTTDKLDGNRKIRKGEFNELIINFVKKYTLLQANENLVEDESKKPENSEDYPYIIEDVDKAIYEQAYNVNDESNFMTPKVLYTLEKGNYETITKTCEDYYNYLLNVDYETINKDEFIKNIKDLLISAPDENVVEEYINYVKNNKISLSGTAKVQIPIIYLDGVNMRVRIKLDFKVNNANTKENLLYYDSKYSNKIIYQDYNTIYIDAILGYVIDSDNVYNKTNTIYQMITQEYKDKLQIIGK